MSDGLDPAVGELLSALLDGQVSAEERATAEQWLARSPEARAEYEDLAAVRSALRGLPRPEPRPGFLESLAPASNVVPGPARWFRGVGAVAASLVATAAAWIALGGVAPAGDAIVPPLDDVTLAAAVTAPDEGFRVIDARGGQVAALRQEGTVDWPSLPAGERPEPDVWIDLTTEPGTARVITVNDDVVWTLVSDDLPAEALVAIGQGLPGGGLLDRVGEACEYLLGG